MYCINCGKELPDDSNFCLKCGKPQREGAQTQEVRWETCEIRWSSSWGVLFTNPKLTFQAKAIGPNGTYTAGESMARGLMGAVQNDDDLGRMWKQAEPALNSLIETLTKDGWESTGTGEKWYNHKFRRRVK